MALPRLWIALLLAVFLLPQDADAARKPRCKPAQPTVVLTPARQTSATPDSWVEFTVTVRNNDRKCKTPTTFSLSVAHPDRSWESFFSSSRLVVAPGKRASVTLKVREPENASNGSYPVKILVSDQDQKAPAHKRKLALAHVDVAQPAKVPPVLDSECAKIPEGEEPIAQNSLVSTGDYRIDALLTPFKWPSTSGTWPVTTLTYSFYEDSVFGGQYYGLETGVREVSAPIKANVRAILAYLSTYINVDFKEVTETADNIGQIRFMYSDGPYYTYAYYPVNPLPFHRAGDVHLNPAYADRADTNGFQHPAGEHGYFILIHELGHTLGLKHPHDDTPNLPATEDNHTTTVMSYNFKGDSASTIMGYDILALQHLYGLREHRTGSDTFIVSRTAVDQYVNRGITYISPSFGTKQSLWDAGGFNVIDLSGLAAVMTSGYRLDLRPLGWLSSWSDFQGEYLVSGLVVGPNVGIHQLINSTSDDTIHASAEQNLFTGYSLGRVTGKDVIYYADAADEINLSNYDPAKVVQTASGSDLVVNLGANGSLTLKNYYASASRPKITFGAVRPRLTVQNASRNEGNSGTSQMQFTVDLNVPPQTTVSASYLTRAVNATPSSDYTNVSGTLTFAPGETSKTIAVPILGDTFNEPSEVFSLELTSLSANLVIFDGKAEGLIVNDDDGQAPEPPIAVVSASTTSGTAPLTVQFTGSDSYDPDGNIELFQWNFGDGSSSTALDPLHTYSAVGTFTATLTVTDFDGKSASASRVITVKSSGAGTNQYPKAVAKVSSVSGLTVQFSGSGSYDPDGSIVTYYWAFGDGRTSSAADPSYTYTSSGTYSARLTVTDNGGLKHSATISVTVAATTLNKPPVAVASASKTSGVAPLAVTFTGSSSYDPDGTISSYLWEFGDGGSAVDPNPVHTFTGTGSYSVQLTVTDDQGARGTKTLTISVNDRSMSIASIAMAASRLSSGPYARATVKVVGVSGAAIPYAMVYGTWSGVVTKAEAGYQADANGVKNFTSPVATQSGTATFTVTRVVKSQYTYVPAHNVETSDSIALVK